MKEPSFNEKNRWIESDKIEKQIVEILMKSKLSLYEMLGMLHHIGFEFERMAGEGVEEFRRQDEN